MEGLFMQNILSNQTLLINELQANDPTLAIEWDESGLYPWHIGAAT
jgi:hypothetical protein